MRLFFLISLISALALEYSHAQDDDPLEKSAVKLLKLPNLKQLASENKKVEIYRLTVGRSFHPLLIFEIGKDAIYVYKVRVASNEDFSRSLRVVRNSRVGFETHEFTALLSLLEAGRFWNLPSEAWLSAGLDGSSWTLEGIKDGKYHCIARSNPFLPFGENTPLKDDVSRLTPERAYSEGRLTAAFIFLWTLSGEASEELY